VNGHRPLQSFLIPTTATLRTSGGSLSDIRWPEPIKKRFIFSDQELAVYEGTVRFESELTLPTTATGKVSLEAVLSYQPCNDSQCFPPATATLNGFMAVTREPET
jgi:DsbC/DsbD-like thiol-disulfide interchange protein